MSVKHTNTVIICVTIVSRLNAQHFFEVSLISDFKLNNIIEDANHFY